MLDGLSAEPAAAQKTHTVTIENMRFTPQDLTVKRSDRILWVNNDLVPHTVTAQSKAFDSGTIAAPGSWAYVVDKRGVLTYVCTFHPTMKGTLTIQ